jgi:hypothetical protein
LVAVSCVAVALAVPAVARAGTYEVAICHDPGSALSAPTDGVTFPTSGAYADAGIYQGCGGGGYLYAALDGLGAHAPSDSAAWRFTAPPGTQIAAAQLWRAFYAGTSIPFASPLDAINTIATDGTVATLAVCAQTYGCTQIGGTNLGGASLLGFGGLTGTAAIQGVAACGGGQTCPAGGIAACPELGSDPCTAASDLYAMVVTLSDSSAPLTSGVTGSLTGAGALSGPAQLTFDATDTGSGLYLVSAVLDGHLVEQVPFDSDGGRCASLGDGDGGTLRFDWAVPCVLSGSGSLTLDTASLADGSHDVQISVQDGAGNSSPVWSGTILTRNAPQGGVPVISGTPQVGRTLTAGPGDWAPVPSAYAYQWWRCGAAGAACVAIAGATSSSYAVLAADRYGALEASVIATDASGWTSATSAPTGPVADVNGYVSAPGRPALLGGSVPSLSGAAKQGSTLVATPGKWSNGPLGYAYAWQRCDAAGLGCTSIARATASRYRLRVADDYGRVRVVVTASGPGGSSVAVSEPTLLVADSHGSTTSPAAGHLANGRGACVSASLRAALDTGATVPYGKVVAVHGTLRCGRTPIAGALLELTLAAAGGESAPALARVRTAADGSFSYVVGAGPSRQITVRYHPFSGASATVATATLRLKVRPSVSLTITPASTTNGHTIAFTGAVSGGREPRGGLALDVEYLEGSSWKVYDTVLASPGSGRFTYRYTFRRTTQPITYTFRVAIPPTGVSGYPFLPAASPARSVRVTP